MQEIAETILSNLRRKRPVDAMPYRVMRLGYKRTGVEINGTKFWILRKGDYVRNSLVAQDGVLVEYPDKTSKIIYND